MNTISWKVLENGFLYMVFPLEGNKLVEFMNFCKGGTSVKEYSLKFIQQSKYHQTLVECLRAGINMFLIGVSGLVEKEFFT